MKKKEKTYIVFTEQYNDTTLCKKMTGSEIRKELHPGDSWSQVGTAIVDGDIIKNFDGEIDLNKL